MTSGLITHLIATYGYFAVFALIALESLGIPLPGETALIAASVYAGSTRHLDIVAIAAVASAAAIIGDNGGYWLGRRGGGALVARYGHIVRLDRRKLKVGRYLFARHGGSVVFFGRFISVLRTYSAFLAGLNRMPLVRFAAANAAGGVVWAAGYAAAAYALGSAAASLGSLVTLVGLGVTTVLTVVGALVLRRHMARLEERAEAMFPEVGHPEVTVAEPRLTRDAVGQCR
ncbi:DedA family protein [Actinospica sp.]|jgi:membrane protein DedA with SNARE-associated domain|uniref:DedA family protein n=1 Tax=Actinospica sp. TaxID=1872142 RepID=UPI002BAC3EFF|nr:DedA family protein [Actinospica sp.]HWG26600.1 DedA family protein [Actinospica sp.]